MYRIKGFSFLGWWLASSVLVWPLAVVALGAVLFPLTMLYSMFRPMFYQNLSLYLFIQELALFPIMGAIIGFVLSTVQRWHLRSRLYWAADGWRFWSVVGGAIGGFVLYILFGGSSSYEFYLYGTNGFLAMPIFLGFIAGCQSLPLRHAVRHPWLWMVGNIVAGVVFTGVLVNNQGNAYDNSYGMFSLGTLSIAVASLGLITGFAMLHLFERHLLPMKPEGMEDLMPQGPRSVWDEAV